jgi:hypothetical protein
MNNPKSHKKSPSKVMANNPESSPNKISD